LKAAALVPTFDKMREESVQPQESPEGEGGKPLEALLAEAQAKIEQQRDVMMRALADAENARKRAQAEIASSRRFALEQFAEGLLPVMDSLEAARKTGDLSGVEITLKQLATALERASIQPIEPKAGERFDPNRHQAMASVESPQPPNTVVSVLQKGYSLHDRVLRPALVTIAKTPSDPISDKD
jgi:molecular chaperone GrpE